jgi:hypothetical protein
MDPDGLHAVTIYPEPTTNVGNSMDPDGSN